jgi:hypothetical protein
MKRPSLVGAVSSRSDVEVLGASPNPSIPSVDAGFAVRFFLEKHQPRNRLIVSLVTLAGIEAESFYAAHYFNSTAGLPSR